MELTDSLSSIIREMGLVEILLAVIAAIAVGLLLITIIRRISAYYRQRYNMSIWAGVFLIVIAAVSIVYSQYHYNSIITPIIIAASVLLFIACALDIRHAGVTMGILALLFQIIMSAAFVVVIVGTVAYFVIRSLRRGNDMVLDAVTGTTNGFRNGIRLFFRFFS